MIYWSENGESRLGFGCSCQGKMGRGEQSVRETGRGRRWQRGKGAEGDTSKTGDVETADPTYPAAGGRYGGVCKDCVLRVCVLRGGVVLGAGRHRPAFPGNFRSGNFRNDIPWMHLTAVHLVRAATATRCMTRGTQLLDPNLNQDDGLTLKPLTLTFIPSTALTSNPTRNTCRPYPPLGGDGGSAEERRAGPIRPGWQRLNPIPSLRLIPV